MDRREQMKLYGDHLMVGSIIEGNFQTMTLHLQKLTGKPFDEFLIEGLPDPQQIYDVAAELAYNYLKPRGLWVEGPRYYDERGQALAYLNTYGLEGPNPAQGEQERELLVTVAWKVVRGEGAA